MFTRGLHFSFRPEPPKSQGGPFPAVHTQRHFIDYNHATGDVRTYICCGNGVHTPYAMMQVGVIFIPYVLKKLPFNWSTSSHARTFFIIWLMCTWITHVIWSLCMQSYHSCFFYPLFNNTIMEKYACLVVLPHIPPTCNFLYHNISVIFSYDPSLILFIKA
jgi:hypothetical protein